MATGQQLTERALSYLGVKKATIPATEDEIASGQDSLMDLFAEWDSVGIRLNTVVTDDSSVDIPVPDFSKAAIKTSLALRLGPEFEVEPRPSLIRWANNAFGDLLNRLFARDFDIVYLPETLPIGRGNQGWQPTWWDDFYPNIYLGAQQFNNGDLFLDELGRIIQVSDVNLKESRGISGRGILTG